MQNTRPAHALNRYLERKREKGIERQREHLTWNDLFGAAFVFIATIIRVASVLARQCLSLVGHYVDIALC